jgi:membrane associated rhomboid family serine protease
LIFKRLLMAFVAISAIATAVSVVVVALAFALFALVQPMLGDAGASAVVAGAFAVIAAIVGFAAVPRRHRRRPGTGSPAGVAEDLMDLVRDKPVASAGVALAAAIMAMRNPRVIGEIARAFFQSRRPPR